MCDALPSVNTCCAIFSLRLGLVFVSVLCIMTGAIVLSAIEKTSNASYDSLKKVSEIRKPKEVMTEISRIIPSGITALSVMFMFLGLCLFFASLANLECLIIIFVFGTFITAIIGFTLVLAIGFECMFKDICTLSSMDWLSGATSLVGMVAFLFLWVYFAVVANSYVVEGG